MVDPLAALVSEFGQKRVLVLGDSMLDEYLIGDCSRISPEAPVPVLRVTSSRRVLGGAANTAANIVSLGGQATLITLAGKDEAGDALRACARQAGVDLLAVDHRLPTLRKTRVVSQQQQMLRIDQEQLAVLTPALEAEIGSLFDACLDGCDIVVISDYAKGLVTPSLARTIIGHAHARGRQVIVDPRPQNRDCYEGCDYLTPNWREARALLRLADAEPTADGARDVAAALAAAFGAHVVLTLGAHGVLFCSRDLAAQFAVPTRAREVFDVSGAGDTVVAALALSHACGADHATAVAAANRAAGVVVAKFGTATVTPDELLQHTDAPRLVPRAGLADLATHLRARQQRIVSVSGSFDVLDHSHLDALNEARRRGDVLIVGLHGDSAIRDVRGSARSTMSERGRAELLLSLRIVDYVHIFDEPDPMVFLQELNPDVHVNCAEYRDGGLEADAVRRGGDIRLASRQAS